MSDTRGLYTRVVELREMILPSAHWEPRGDSRAAASKRWASGPIRARRLFFSDRTDDQLGGLLRRGAGEPLEIDGGLFGIDGLLVVGELEAGVAGDVGADTAWMDRRRRDAALLDVELGAQGVGEAAHGELGGVVGRLARDAEQAEHARDVDDVTVPRRLEMGEEGERPVHDSPEVDVHQPSEVVVGHRVDVRRQRDAGVVEDQVHPPVLRDHVGGPCLDSVAIGDVDVSDIDVDRTGDRGGLFDERHRLGESGVVDVAECHVASRRRQLDGERSPDARSRAGDRRDLAGEVLHPATLNVSL